MQQYWEEQSRGTQFTFGANEYPRALHADNICFAFSLSMQRKKMELYYHSICVKSRFIRLILTEIAASYGVAECKFWEHPKALLDLNPLATLPVLVDDNQILAEINSILSYLKDSNKLSYFESNYEDQMLYNFIMYQFNYDVVSIIMSEKVIRFYTQVGSPEVKLIRAAKENLQFYLHYFNKLLTQRKWLAGNKIGLADFAAGSAISLLDYFNEINWQENNLKNWYMVIKSRPSFRVLLNEKITGFNPVSHYHMLDF